MASNPSLTYEPKVKISLSSSAAPAKGIVVRFMEGQAQAQFGEVDQTPGSLFFQSTGSGDGILNVSIGKGGRFESESYRIAAAEMVKWMRANHLSTAALDLQAIEPAIVMETVPAVVEGLILGDYRFELYKSDRKELADLQIELLIGAAHKFEHLASKAEILAKAVCMARDWSHEPANTLNPVTLADRVRSLAAQNGLTVRVLDDKELEKIGAGALVAVGKGSETPARLIVLEYPGHSTDPAQKPVVLVGKAITFDTGGYSIKTVEGIKGMKYDKSGGMDVIAAVLAAAQLRLNQRVVAVIGAAENNISSNSYKPDDILKTLSGKTVEVVTTDAEGRLVLADCLSYAQKEYSPKVMIDFATLTSAIVTALGSIRAGLFSNDDVLASSLLGSADHTHELLWRMPLDDAYLVGIRSDDADIKNAGIKEGQAIQAAVFLKQFVEPAIPWAHLDIAATATTEKELPYCIKGATGFGVRLVLDYLIHMES